MRPVDNGRATPRAASRRAGFSLVELLVVIGIIAVLAGLVLTVRSRASEGARSVQCLNNLRQIGMAMTLYAQSNDQAFPFGSPGGRPTELKEDWIYFRTGELGLPKYVNGSAIAPYARLKGEAFLGMMRCPGDDMDNHKPGASSFPYRFSYSMNAAMTSDLGKDFNRGATPRVTAVNRAAEKILVVEENELTIDDGLWNAGAYSDPNNRSSKWNVDSDYLSIRHETKKGEFKDPKGFAGRLFDQTKRGNVLFVDGHVEPVSRQYAHSPQHVLVSDEGTGTVPPE